MDKKRERIEGKATEGTKSALRKMAKKLDPPIPVQYYVGKILEDHVKKSKK